MEYRQLGKTSLRVSILGFGASPLGNVFRQTDPAESREAVRYAIDQGINFFDVSPYYGLTVAEARLGEALEGHRHKVILATKCGRYGVSDFDFSARRVASSINESLTRLRTDYVDLFQAHDVEFGDSREILDETIPAMRRLQEQGKARYIGITGYSLANLSKLAEQVAIDSVLTYCRYNLMITDMDSVLVPAAKKRGFGIINASALHMGILTEQGAPDWHPAPPEVREVGQRIVELCQQHGADASEIALRFAFDHPLTASTLVGMSTRDHVETNLRALGIRNNLKLMAKIRKLVAPVFNYIWASGRPENYG